MLTLDPIRQIVLWRGIAQRGMPAPAVVERLDVVEGVGNRLSSRFVACAMHPLVLEAVEEAFGRRVILVVRRHRQTVLRVRRRLVAPFVPGPDAVLRHQPFNARLACRKAEPADFPNHARAAVGTLEFGMDGANQRQQPRIAQALPVRRAVTFPGLIFTGAHAQCRAQGRQRVGLPLPVDPSVLHSASFAKYAVAFLGFRTPF